MTNPTISARKKQVIISVLLIMSAFIMAVVAGCDSQPPLSLPACPAAVQWSGCYTGSSEAFCWTGAPCANGDEDACRGPNPVYPPGPPPVVGCTTPTGLTCIKVEECDTR